mgnify:CR=1 FL=1
MTFIYVVLTIMLVFIAAIITWVVIKNAETDRWYEEEIRKIYERKR